MSLSLMLFIVSVLMVIGIISLADALIRIIVRTKNGPESVVLWISGPDKMEYSIKKAVKKYPSSKIIIEREEADEETDRMLKILQREYPYILIHKSRNPSV